MTRHLGSNHTILKVMLAGYLPPAMVMVQRSGRVVAALTAPGKRSAEAVSLNVDAFDPATERQALVQSAETAERSMPTG